MESKRIIRKYWDEKAEDFFIGKKIVEARYLTEEEMISCFGIGCDKVPLALFFDDGSYTFPQMDDEGNDGGALAISGQTGVLPVLSREILNGEVLNRGEE